jgi:hypothetical protein
MTEDFIDKAKVNWRICNGDMIVKGKGADKELVEEREIELCADMAISINKKEFDEIRNFRFDDIIDNSEEESLMKLRVLWAIYLGGDLNDEKRMKRLNRSHLKAMEVLKDIERKSEEQMKLGLKEGELLIEDSLNRDLKLLNFIRVLWDLNEIDRSMRIVVCEKGEYIVLFSHREYGEFSMEYYQWNMGRDDDILAKQIGNLMMLSGIGPEIIEKDVDHTLKNMVMNVVIEYYSIVEAVISKVDEIISVDEFESEVLNASKELINFRMWLNKLYEGMIKNGFVKIIVETKNDLLMGMKKKYYTQTTGSGKGMIGQSQEELIENERFNKKNAKLVRRERMLKEIYWRGVEEEMDAVVFSQNNQNMSGSRNKKEDVIKCKEKVQFEGKRLIESVGEIIRQGKIRDENKIKCRQKEADNSRESKLRMEQMIRTWGDEEHIRS